MDKQKGGCQAFPRGKDVDHEWCLFNRGLWCGGCKELYRNKDKHGKTNAKGDGSSP